MLLALQYEALVQAVMAPDKQNGIFSRSKIALTRAVLEEYNSKVSADPEFANYYFPFIQAVSNKLKILPSLNSEGLSLIEEYIYSAKYGGKKLALSDFTELSPTDSKNCELNGVRIIKVDDLFADEGRLGYEPFEIYKISHGAKCNPSLIEHFFKNESHVLFYDKYINQDAVSLINYLIGHTHPQCSITIVTSRNAACDIRSIRALVKSGGTRKIRIELADRATSERIHDRFIYVDRHYELHIPRGLDLFGGFPDWVNSNGVINVYDVFKCGVEIQLSFESHGNNRPRPITIRSIVNS